MERREGAPGRPSGVCAVQTRDFVRSFVQFSSFYKIRKKKTFLFCCCINNNHNNENDDELDSFDNKSIQVEIIHIVVLVIAYTNFPYFEIIHFSF